MGALFPDPPPVPRFAEISPIRAIRGPAPPATEGSGRTALATRAVLLLCLIQLSAAVASAEDEYALTVKAGFAGEARSERPLAVQVLLSRKESLIDAPPGGAGIDTGELTLRVTSANGHVDEETIDRVAIAPGETKRFDRVTPPGVSVQATFRAAGRELAAAETDPAYSTLDPDRLVIALGGPGRWLALVHEQLLDPEGLETDSRRGGALPARLIVLPAESRELPVHPAAYAGADLVAVGDLGDPVPSAEHAEALLGWVRSGGRVLLLGGRHALHRRGTPWEAFFPCEPGDEVPTAFPREAETAWNAPGLAQVRVPVSRGVAGLGAALFPGDGPPLVVERALGLGRVLYLNFDPTARPLRGGEWESVFWLGLLRWALRDSVPRDLRVPVAGEATAPMEPPEPKWILLFVLGYALAIGPANWLALRGLGRERWLWVTTPAIALGFLAGSLALDRAAVERPLHVRQWSVVALPADGAEARWTTQIDFFSAARAPVRLHLPNGAVVVDSAALESSPGGWATSMRHRVTAEGQEYDFALEKWSMRRLTVHGRGPVPWAVAFDGAGGATLRSPEPVRHAVRARPDGRDVRAAWAPGERWAPGAAGSPAGWNGLAEGPAALGWEPPDALELPLWSFFAPDSLAAAGLADVRGDGVAFVVDRAPMAIRIEGLVHRLESCSLVVVRAPDPGERR